MSSDDTLGTAQISDSLDSLSERDRILDAAIRPLHSGMRAFGPARTAQFAPVEHDSDHPYDDMIDFIDGIERGQVVVIAASGHRRSGLWGELFSAAALGHGASGVVCDGYIRDRDRILPLDFPVFGRGSRPIDFRARMRLISTDQPVTCGNVLIHPGDVILADNDGCAAIPAALQHRVLDLARDRAARESNVLDELRAGASLRSVWERFGTL